MGIIDLLFDLCQMMTTVNFLECHFHICAMGIIVALITQAKRIKLGNAGKALGWFWYVVRV